MNKSIQCKGSTVFYTVKGKGIPVLMLHGFGEDSKIWDSISIDEGLYQLILPDLPGSGRSPDFSDEKASLSDFADCIAQILENENIPFVHFIGHSMGGYIAMEFANLYPDKLKSLGLFHSSAFADDAEKIEMRKKAIDFIKSNGVTAFFKTSIPGLFKDAHQNKAAEKLLQEGENFTAKALVQYYEAMIARKDHADLLPNLSFPFLYIIGEHDKAIPFPLSLKQCYLPSVSYVHILRNSVHMGMCEEPGKVNNVIREFLSEVAKG